MFGSYVVFPAFVAVAQTFEILGEGGGEKVYVGGISDCNLTKVERSIDTSWLV